MGDAAAQTRSVVVEREVAFPPAKIWRALTQPHLLQEWLMKNEFAPLGDQRFRFRSGPVEVECQVRAVEPERTLTYTWAAMGAETVVTWTLTPTNGGTRLRMEHAGFRPDQPRAFHGARLGWERNLDALEQVLARPD